MTHTTRLKIEAHIDSLSIEARADIAAGKWDEVVTDALYAAAGAQTTEDMEAAKALAQELATENAKLTVGDYYEVDALEHIGWTKGDGSGHEGYHYQDYFSPSGAYLGPDCTGIEPLFA